jgi:hypothetical protein
MMVCHSAFIAESENEILPPSARELIPGLNIRSPAGAGVKYGVLEALLSFCLG